MKTKKIYQIIFQDEASACEPHYQVICDNDIIASFPTREKAQQFVEERKHTIVLQTKTIDSYFRGIIRKVYFPFDGHKYAVCCLSYAGPGCELDVLDFKADTEAELLNQLIAFKNQHNLLLETL